SNEALVRVFVKGDTLWEQGDSPGDRIRFLARGRVEYYWKNEDQLELVDIRDVGDLLGLTALFDQKAFVVKAVVAEDSLFYEFNWEKLRPHFESNDLARNYIRRHLFWATRLGNKISLPNDKESQVVSRSKNILQAHLDGAQLIQPRRKERLLTCGPEISIEEAASKMIDRRIPSVIVVNGDGHPKGIVTHKDLVNWVLVKKKDSSGSISTIMSSPVVTVEAKSSSTAALLLMLQSRIGQVCVTEDGTDQSELLDVCTEKDLLAQSGHHPAGLLREIQNARTLKRLRELCDDTERIVQSYLEASVSSVFVGQICAELYDELVHSLITMKKTELEAEDVQLPDIPWAWIAVGSDGRREQLLRTDIDNGILFQSSGDLEKDDANRKQLTKLGAAVIEGMVQCGFARCQGGVMASNPNWCRTDAEWRQEIERLNTFMDPEKLLRAFVAFDMRRVSGNKALFESMRSHLFETVSGSPGILRRIAESVVATPPPLNFMKQFVVEKKGRHEGEFDIKSRAIAPLRGAAQLLVFKNKLMRRYSTGGRWEDVKLSVKALEEIAGYAEESYEFLLRLRTLNGLKRGDSGRFVEPSSITKLERAQLTHSFDVVRMIQKLIANEFQLDNRM
ncbi:MAG: DUF294 nucleotidyltransferase-like domain-containing protein, partial [Opitutales bacterium]|nr:DUF294 nucleotidyltransferase-like domain-containing protein [Opitutales bacterium]